MASRIHSAAAARTAILFVSMLFVQWRRTAAVSVLCKYKGKKKKTGVRYDLALVFLFAFLLGVFRDR